MSEVESALVEAAPNPFEVDPATIVALPEPDIGKAGTGVAVDAPASDLVETLETILKALGHEIPVFWNEAVALAKKAI